MASKLLNNIIDLINKGIASFFANFFNQLISFFGKALADIMGTSVQVLNMPIVQNGIKYSQALAMTLLVLKALSEAITTYILYQNGDPDADPSGILVRTGEAVAIIATLPWLVQQLFTFGSYLSHDVAGLNTGKAGVKDWSFLVTAITSTGGSVIALVCIVIAICLLVVAIQASIRGAELALMSVIGPVMAVNLAAANRALWSAWLKQLIIICVSQCLQIFLLDASLSSLTSQSVSGGGLIFIIGWLWVTIKTPKFIEQIAYSTGFSGAAGGVVKSAGSIAIMRAMASAA